ncbi:MAG: DNA-3-methyladenine glycosylase I [Gaiellaceae bacterium]
MAGPVMGDDGVSRCWWAAGDPLLRAYHDHEWGRPQRDDDPFFELLTREAFQAGLSWTTILRKRDGFRRAFAQFRIEVIAGFDEHDVARLLTDASIVRHRGKIEATVANARAAAALDQSLAELVWTYAPAARRRPHDATEIPAQTAESAALAKELRLRGFRFLGPTTGYAFMQAAGLVDDHVDGCVVPLTDAEHEPITS